MAARDDRPKDITDVTDSSEAEPIQPHRKRGAKRKFGAAFNPRKRFDLDDDVGIQLVLSKKCVAGCTKRCKEQFHNKQSYAEFKAFRTNWKGYHKTDQDQIETWSLLSPGF